MSARRPRPSTLEPVPESRPAGWRTRTRTRTRIRIRIRDTSALPTNPLASSRFGNHDGVLTVVDDLTVQPLQAHLTLTRSERSSVPGLVTGLLEAESLSPG